MGSDAATGTRMSYVTGTQMPGASAGVLVPSAWPLSAAPEGLWSPAGDLLSCVTVARCRQTPQPHRGLYKCPSMAMVRQLSSAWKEEELLATFKKHRSTFSPAEITEYFYSNDKVFLPCQNGNFQEVYQLQEKKYAPSLVLALLRLWPLYSVFNLPNLSTCPDETTTLQASSQQTIWTCALSIALLFHPPLTPCSARSLSTTQVLL